ncbi:hypothetical protein CLF_101708 [Clonorchis sinensis]|uniref:Uncharacterized protein n=1 Tax=Clonorchis sinensis TaxID=79923 RepID=G7Y6D5_CLOSI|nr:hypothetical protein CLF_101708 [Clonorchis sinensis]
MSLDTKVLQGGGSEATCKKDLSDELKKILTLSGFRPPMPQKRTLEGLQNPGVQIVAGESLVDLEYADDMAYTFEDQSEEVFETRSATAHIGNSPKRSIVGAIENSPFSFLDVCWIKTLVPRYFECDSPFRSVIKMFVRFSPKKAHTLRLWTRRRIVAVSDDRDVGRGLLPSLKLPMQSPKRLYSCSILMRIHPQCAYHENQSYERSTFRLLVEYNRSVTSGFTQWRHITTHLLITETTSRVHVLTGSPREDF